jgi:hypothetical protein
MSQKLNSRRCFVRALVAGLVSASGCSASKPLTVQPVVYKPGPLQDIHARASEKPTTRLHNWIADKKNKLLKPNPMP